MLSKAFVIENFVLEKKQTLGKEFFIAVRNDNTSHMGWIFCDV